jgi:3-keto-disaccharide hydrolase/GMC oxidoreductase
MATNAATQITDFSRDVPGRYVCNGLDEALRSADRSIHPEARPFDVVIVGGGSFGSVLAARLLRLDATHAHRILVLEAGPMLFTEHVQNLPPSMDTPEVWGVPWNSDSPKSWNQQFPGLAYCLGGRSIFWGGWSPYLIESEHPSPPWPASVVHDLTTPVVNTGGQLLSYLDHAAEQIGTSQTNDFVNGALHRTLRQVLHSGLTNRPGGVDPVLTGARGHLAKVDDLEAPLAVQSSSPRPGFFPFNKFNAAQLLIRAARIAEAEAEQASASDAETRNVFKRLMVVPNTHVIRLERDGRRITRIVAKSLTSPWQDVIDIPNGGLVFIAQGTIESTRTALDTLPNAHGLIGRNLMAHLRSNLTIRIPRSNFGPALDPSVHPNLRELEVSALFVKGIHQPAPADRPGHFHLQITASGVGQLETNSEAELFKKIPNIDELDRFRSLTDDKIVATIRGIGEMTGDRASIDPQNRIILDTAGPQGPFDYGRPRALVRLEAGPKDAADPRGDRDLRLWDVMDSAAEEVALTLADGGPIEYLAGAGWIDHPPSLDARRDKLSSTHHEGGTLWMGTDPSAGGDPSGWGVTDELGRFWESDNLFAVGPALLPTLGSPNPMLTGVALTRRTADRLIGMPPAPVVSAGFSSLFDGTEASARRWLQAGGGAFALVDGALIAQPNGPIGLLYYAAEQFDDFVLRLKFLLPHPAGLGNDNSGVFVRFRDPRLNVPDRQDPAKSWAYDNRAFVAVDTGFEIQIDEEARGDTRFGEADGHFYNRTGAIYKVVEPGTQPGQQHYTNSESLAANTWHELEIEVIGQRYRVVLNGEQATSFENSDGYRGKPHSADRASGFIGVQTHTGNVAFRDIRIKRVAVPAVGAGAQGVGEVATKN